MNLDEYGEYDSMTKTLTFGSDFNQSVNNLPNSITHLIFGWEFDQSVNELPNSIFLDKSGSMGL